MSARESAASRLEASSEEVSALASMLRQRRIVVLSGAGCSTESGIPDYRGPDGRFRDRDPIRYLPFVEDPDVRRRYWARSAVGWPRFARARPNDGHRALARLEAAGYVRGVITQNVDGLHHEAGSRRVVELHGSLGRVRCLDCGAREPRATVQERLRALNPERGLRIANRRPADAAEAGVDPKRRDVPVEMAPDGDAEVPESVERGFRVPACVECGGTLKPDVVFFGECVPPARVERAWDLFSEGDCLLVVGSSLAVYSGRRFVHRAVRDGLPVVVVNLGATRADDVAVLKVERAIGDVLPEVVERMSA